MGKLTIYVQKKNEPVLDKIPHKSLFFNNVLRDLNFQIEEKIRAAEKKMKQNGGNDEKQTKKPTTEEKPKKVS